MFLRKRILVRALAYSTSTPSIVAVLLIGTTLFASAQEAPTQPSPLQGSWLLAGSPASGWSSWGAELKGPERIQTFDANDVALAATFSVHGNLVTASYTVVYRCGGGYGAGSDLVSGKIAADGSFVLGSSSTKGIEPAFSLAISGRVPDAPGSKWEGTYTYKFSAKGACVGTLSSSFRASPILIRPGKFVGHNTLLLGEDSSQGYTSSYPIDVSLNVVSVENQPANAGQEAEPGFGWISLRMKVVGNPCYQPADQELRFALHGSTFAGDIPMTDGSTILMNGWIQDVEAHHLYLGLVTKKPGSCIHASSAGLVVSRAD